MKKYFFILLILAAGAALRRRLKSYFTGRTALVLSFAFLSLLSFSPLHAQAAERYWVGGSGNWSDDDNHWAATSGGAPANGNVPTSADNAHFDANSNTTAYTVTVDTSASMLDLMFDAAPSVSGTITWAGTSAVNIYGSLSMLSGMTAARPGTHDFKATASGKTLTFNGVTLSNDNVTFNGVGGGWTLQDAFTVGGNSGIYLTNGTLNTNSQTVSAYLFQSTGGTLTLGASSLTFNKPSTPTAWNVTSGLTLSANTSTINLTGSGGGFTGGGLTTYNTVVLSGGGGQAIAGANTFANLTVSGSTGGYTYAISADQTVTGTLTLTGSSASSRMLLSSNTAGTARTITAAAVNLTDVDFQDVTAVNSSIVLQALNESGADTATSFTDQSSAAHTITTGGNFQWDTAQFPTGLSSSGLSDGTGDYLALDGSSDFTFGTSDFTVEFWVRFNALGSAYVLYDSRPSGVNGLYPDIYVTGTSLRVFINSADVITGTTVLTTGTWYHVAWARSGTSSKLFLNGVQEGSTYTDSNDYLNAAARPMIASNGSGGGANFGLNGWIASLKVYKGYAAYTGTFTPPSLPLRAWSGTRLGDAAGNSGITFVSTDKYYVGTTANWNGTVWALTSGGAAAANNFPLPQDRAILDAGSFSSNGQTLTINGAYRLPSIVATSTDQTYTLATGSNAPTLYGTAYTLDANVTISGTGALTFSGRNTQTITSSGETWTQPFTINSIGGTVTLADNLTTGSSITTILTKGTLDLNGKTLSTGLFESENSNTRAITSGGGGITLTGNNNSIWYVNTATNLTFNDSLQIDSTYSGSTGSRIFLFGGAGGLTADNMKKVSLKISAGTDTVAQHYMGWNNLDFTGFAGTVNVGAYSGTGGTLYGNLTLSSGMTITSFHTLTFAATSGTQVITTNGKTLDTPITVNAPGATVQLADNLTMGSTQTFTLTAGTLDLNSKTLTAKAWSSSNSNTRSVNVAGGSMSLSGNDLGSPWNMQTATNFTVTNGPLVVNATYSGSTGTRQINHGFAAGYTENNSPNFNITGGTDTIEVVAGGVGSLDFTGFAGTFTPSGGGYGDWRIYGDLTISTGMTVANTSSVTSHFAATSGTQTITSNGKTLDYLMTVNAPGATVQLADNLTLGSTRTFTLTAGTLDLNGKTLSTGIFAPTGSTARTIQSSVAGGKITTTSTSATTVWSSATVTNLTVTRSPAWTIEIGGNTTNIRTFAGGGATWPALSFTNTTASGELDFSGSNTFKSISIGTPPQTLKFTSGTNTSIEDTTTGFPSGTSGSLITIGTISGTATLTKSGGGRVCSNFLALSNITGSPSTAAWYVGANSTGSGTGLVFTACPEVPATNPIVPHVSAGMLTATGGTVSTVVEKGVTYKVHTFRSSGTFKVTGGSGNVQYLVVGGGGGGGGCRGGGGGGGGVLTNGAYNYPVSVGMYAVSVGAGGTAGGGASCTSANGGNGGNSAFDTLTASGGGGANSPITGYNGSSGGSGGGASYNSGTGLSGTAGSGTPGQGNGGGNGVAGTGGTAAPAGGGGGAGAAGANGANKQGGAGGIGVSSSISGSATYYGGGGGGGLARYDATYLGGAGGLGGGGDGLGGLSLAGEDGTANTGGGGGGGAAVSNQNGGAGGSGIVIIRYPVSVSASKSASASGLVGHWTFDLADTERHANVWYLVVGGGGGGGSQGGGGGAGGVLTNSGYTYTVAKSSYTVTIGNGGSGGAGGARGSNGGNSVFDRVTAIGGGGGGAASPGPTTGANGGSGGGAAVSASVEVGGSGTVGQGNDGGNNSSSANYGGGGGGGAGAIGSNGSTTNGGDGGSGLASTISGASVTYAGGGGGGVYLNGIAAGTGAAGGGNGSIFNAAPTAAAANTGSGGGGSGSTAATGGAGGSGIVVIRYPSNSMIATGGTITTAGNDTVHTFTSSGTFSVTAIQKTSDRSGKRNSGDLIAGPTIAKGKFGQALNLNGSSQYADIGSSSSVKPTGAITMSAWFNSNSVSSAQPITVARASTAIFAGANMSLTSSKLRVLLTTTGGNWEAQFFGDDTLLSNTWYHGVVTYDGATVKMYVNGVLQSTTAATTGSIVYDSASRLIGHDSDSSSYFNGLIDDVRIYNRALSATEITNMYKAGGTATVNASKNTTLTSGLVGLWSFDGKDINWATNTFYDRSGQGNNATSTGMSTSTSPVAGKIGQALDFAGNNNLVISDSSSLDLTNNFSLSIWFRSKNPAQSQSYVLGKLNTATSDNAYSIIWRYPGTNVIQFYSQGSPVGYPASNTNITVNDSTWHHILYTYDGSTFSGYLDGTSAFTPVSASFSLTAGTGALILGAFGGVGGGHFFQGFLDDVRIYSRALSPAEVKLLYNLGR